MDIFTDVRFAVGIAYLLIINIVTFIVYGSDKNKAKKGKWRVSEDTLLLLAVMGGSIGAILGMKVFHHKTKKKTFYVGLPVILLLQVLLMIGVIGLGYLNII